jgi:hypothetical protein
MKNSSGLSRSVSFLLLAANLAQAGGPSTAGLIKSIYSNSSKTNASTTAVKVEAEEDVLAPAKDLATDALGDEILDQTVNFGSKGAQVLGQVTEEGSALVRSAGTVLSKTASPVLSWLADDGSTITLLKSAGNEAVTFAPEMGEIGMNLAEGATAGSIMLVAQKGIIAGENQALQLQYQQGGVINNTCHSGDGATDLICGMGVFNSGASLTPVYVKTATAAGFDQEGNPIAGYQSGMAMTNTLNPYFPGNASLPQSAAGNQNVSFPLWTASLDPKTGIQTNYNHDGTTATFTPIPGVGSPGVGPDGTPAYYPLETYTQTSKDGKTTGSGYYSANMGMVNKCSADPADGSYQICTDQEGDPVRFSSAGESPSASATQVADASLTQPQCTASSEGIPSCTDTVSVNGGDVAQVAVDPSTPLTATIPLQPVAEYQAQAMSDPGAAPPTDPNAAAASASAPAAAQTTADAQPVIPQSGGADCSGITDPDQLKTCQANLVKPTTCLAKDMAAKAGRDVSNYDCSATDQKLTATQNSLTALNTGLQLDQQAKGNAQLANVNGDNSQATAQAAAQNMAANAQQADTTKGVGSLAAALIASREASKHVAAASDPDLIAAANPNSYQTLPGSVQGMVIINPINGMSKVALQSGAGIMPEQQVPATQVAAIVGRATAYAAKARAQETTEVNKARSISSTNVKSAASAILDASGASQAGKAAAGVAGDLSGGGGGGDGSQQGD